MPLKSGQVYKKWSSRRTDRSGKRWVIFIFSLKMIQRGDHWTIFSTFFALWNLLILLVIACLSHLPLIIWVFKKNDQVIRLSIQLEEKENFYLELECGPAQPYLFLYQTSYFLQKLAISCKNLFFSLVVVRLVIFCQTDEVLPKLSSIFVMA